MQDSIEIGYQVFMSDGGEEVGAVREVSPNSPRRALARMTSRIVSDIHPAIRLAVV